MKKILLNVGIVSILGVGGLLAGGTLSTPVPEPVAMLFFGTGLIGIAQIARSGTDKK